MQESSSVRNAAAGNARETAKYLADAAQAKAGTEGFRI